MGDKSANQAWVGQGTACTSRGGDGGAATADTDWEGLDRLRAPLHRYLMGRCRDDHEAEDLVHETFLRAARYRRGQTSPGRLYSWVLRIASNVLHDHTRRAVRHPATGIEEELLDEVEGAEPSPCDTTPEDWLELGGKLVDRELLMGGLDVALDQLGDGDRAVIGAYYGGDQSCAATAASCDLPLPLVKVRLFRARKRLRSALRRTLGRGCVPADEPRT